MSTTSRKRKRKDEHNEHKHDYADHNNAHPVSLGTCYVVPSVFTRELKLQRLETIIKRADVKSCNPSMPLSPQYTKKKIFPRSQHRSRISCLSDLDISTPVLSDIRLVNTQQTKHPCKEDNDVPVPQMNYRAHLATNKQLQANVNSQARTIAELERNLRVIQSRQDSHKHKNRLKGTRKQ
jgi:hypothetical protein